MKRVIDRVLVAGLVVLGAALAWVVSGSLKDGVVHVGDTAPDFKVVTDDGRVLTRSDFGGKLLVLNFWASWCDPCREEVPTLELFQRAFANRGVVVLGVSVDKNEKLYHRFLEEFPVTFKTARDPSWDIATSYGTFQLPETYIIDQSGKVRQKVISSQNWVDKDFLQSVAKLL